jgi:hypothetical protein
MEWDGRVVGKGGGGWRGMDRGPAEAFLEHVGHDASVLGPNVVRPGEVFAEVGREAFEGFKRVVLWGGLVSGEKSWRSRGRFSGTYDFS